MITIFKHKGLKQFYETGSTAGINPKHKKRLRIILARLDACQTPQDMNLPGLKLHLLKGKLKDFWSVTISGNWRLIFQFAGNNAINVDYLDYH